MASFSGLSLSSLDDLETPTTDSAYSESQLRKAITARGESYYCCTAKFRYSDSWRTGQSLLPSVTKGNSKIMTYAKNRKGASENREQPSRVQQDIWCTTLQNRVSATFRCFHICLISRATLPEYGRGWTVFQTHSDHPPAYKTLK